VSTFWVHGLFGCHQRRVATLSRHQGTRSRTKPLREEMHTTAAGVAAETLQALLQLEQNGL